MYKVLFIDESQDEIDAFLNYIENNDNEKKFDVIPMFPLAEIPEMVEAVFKSKVDAVVIDYLLNEYKTEINYNVPYNGVNLMEEVLAHREGFPCFIMTSFDDEAIKESFDVNLVYIKGILHGEEPSVKSTFIERLENQIKHYRKRIEEAEAGINELVQKSKEGKLTASEEERLLELDDFLEKAIHKPSKIPSTLKENTNLDHLHKLINDTDMFLQQLNDSKKDG